MGFHTLPLILFLVTLSNGDEGMVSGLKHLALSSAHEGKTSKSKKKRERKKRSSMESLSMDSKDDLDLEDDLSEVPSP